MRSRSRRALFGPALLIAAPVAAIVAACGDGGAIVDDWGPPAGYALLTGAVRHADGAPAGGAEVTYTGCEPPLGGFLAAGTTDAAGRYRVVAALPPRGLFPPVAADTLRPRCDVHVGRGGTPVDSVRVRFGPTRADAPATALDVTVP
jgi:hypothetical protein